MDKRYQVFVSSTFVDLQEERKEVMQALLELDCLPAGMELFPAANDSQWDLIKKVIDESDYYVLIVGGRYGTPGADGLSYTEMEYRHAVSIGKPVISFLHKNPGTITAEKSEGIQEGKEKLAEFRKLVQTRLCKFWETPHELGSVVSRSLIQLVKTSPAIGWVRGDQIAGSDATSEILRLRNEIELLQLKLRSARTSAPKEAEGLASGEEEQEVHFLYKAFENRYSNREYLADCVLTWNEIFSCVAPTMLNEADEKTLQSALNSYLEMKCLPDLYKLFKDEDVLSEFSIAFNDFQTIKIQLRSLGLITQSTKTRSVKDSGSYWTLTPYGDEQMTRLLAIRSGHNHDSEVSAKSI